MFWLLKQQVGISTSVPHFNDKGPYQCQQTCRVSLCGKGKALSSQVETTVIFYSLSTEQKIREWKMRDYFGKARLQRQSVCELPQSWISSSSVSYRWYVFSHFWSDFALLEERWFWISERPDWTRMEWFIFFLDFESDQNYVQYKREIKCVSSTYIVMHVRIDTLQTTFLQQMRVSL